MVIVALLAARHFATTAWPLSRGHPGWFVAAGLLLLLARAKTVALAARNGGAALAGVVLPGRFDDATRIVAVSSAALGVFSGAAVFLAAVVMLLPNEPKITSGKVVARSNGAAVA